MLVRFLIVSFVLYIQIHEYTYFYFSSIIWMKNEFFPLFSAAAPGRHLGHYPTLPPGYQNTSGPHGAASPMHPAMQAATQPYTQAPQQYQQVSRESFTYTLGKRQCDAKITREKIHTFTANHFVHTKCEVNVHLKYANFLNGQLTCGIDLVSDLYSSVFSYENCS